MRGMDAGQRFALATALVANVVRDCTRREPNGGSKGISNRASDPETVKFQP